MTLQASGLPTDGIPSDPGRSQGPSQCPGDGNQGELQPIPAASVRPFCLLEPHAEGLLEAVAKRTLKASRGDDFQPQIASEDCPQASGALSSCGLEPAPTGGKGSGVDGVYQVDFIVLARFMKILSDLCLAFQKSIINIHPSLLPSFPGPMPIAKPMNTESRWQG